MHYIYDATGQKLATVDSEGSFTYYRSVMVYTGSVGVPEQLVLIHHPEGTVVVEGGLGDGNNDSGGAGGGHYVYRYHLTDYIGNVRSVAAAYAGAAGVAGWQEVQATDYYPFGLAHSYNDLHKNRYLFTGKEFVDQRVGASSMLGLYDFGARHYDPILGRWFNPDPALQTTNPYLFCGNAPMVYIDPNGEWFLIDDLIAAAVGGLFNSIAGLITGDIQSVGHFFASFGAGAAAGWTTLYAGPAAGGILLGSMNSVLSQGFNNGWDNINAGAVIFSGFTGGATSVAGAQLNKALAPFMDKITGNITSPVIQQTVNKGLTGTASGFAIGTGVALVQGESFEDALQAGGTNALFGLTMGSVSGFANGYLYAQQNNLNPWTGKSTLPPDFTPKGDNITLYRGMSGNEDPNKPLFMTDNPEYAKQYGSNVQKVTVDRMEFLRLQNNLNGGVEQLRGQYFNSPMLGTEYKITNPQLNQYILNNIQR